MWTGRCPAPRPPPDLLHITYNNESCAGRTGHNEAAIAFVFGILARVSNLHGNGDLNRAARAGHGDFLLLLGALTRAGLPLILLEQLDGQPVNKVDVFLVPGLKPVKFQPDKAGVGENDAQHSGPHPLQPVAGLPDLMEAENALSQVVMHIQPMKVIKITSDDI